MVSRFLLPAEYVARYGTDGPPSEPEEARAYTRQLARAHYENFHVATFLLPRELRQDFYNVYAFCRWADDLGDEIGDRERSLELLEWWNGELAAMYEGRTRHPVFVALAETVEKRQIPREPFANLIRAFVRDQHQTRYETLDDLLDYCRYSANPVGQLVLHVCGYADEGRIELSDFTCTALQLANFWQDVARDFQIGRIYIPLEYMERHEYSPFHLEHDVKHSRASKKLRGLMRELVDHAEELFQKGLPLVETVNRRLAFDLDLFSRGGRAVLDLIRRRDYDVLSHRLALSKPRRLLLLAQAAKRQYFDSDHLEAARRRSMA
jgi:squalene synthase HpnC